MGSPSPDIQREIVALLHRIVGDQPLPADLQRKALEILASWTAATSANDSSAGLVSSLAAVIQSTHGAGSVPASGNRRLIYVHGICRHDSGYSNSWWNALHPFEPTAFGD